MSYYRSFANLVSLVGVVTLGLIAAAVFFNLQMMGPAAEEAAAPDAPAAIAPAGTSPRPGGAASFDRAAVEALSQAPAPPPRSATDDPAAAGVNPVSAPANGSDGTADIEHGGLQEPVDIKAGLAPAKIEKPLGDAKPARP